jgi:dihydrodipicolinate synthase/N-acetylneuraminate lyase
MNKLTEAKENLQSAIELLEHVELPDDVWVTIVTFPSHVLISAAARDVDQVQVIQNAFGHVISDWLDYSTDENNLSLGGRSGAVSVQIAVVTLAPRVEVEVDETHHMPHFDGSF